VDVLRYRFNRVAASIEGKGISARSKAVEAEVAQLAELGLKNVEPVRRRMIIKEVAKIAGVGEEIVARAVPAARSAARATPASDQAPTEAERLTRGRLTSAEALLGCMLCDASLLSTLNDADRRHVAADQFDSEVLTLVRETLDRLPPGDASLSGVLAAIRDTDAKSAATILADRTSRMTEESSGRLHAHWNDTLQRARIEAIAANESPLVNEHDSAARIAELIRRRGAPIQELGGNKRTFPRPN
jgi:hypothetical protein